MQRALALPILEAVYNLSESDHGLLQSVTRATTRLAPRGPVSIGRFRADATIDLSFTHFERAEDRYAQSLSQWPQTTPIAVRRMLLSLTPRVINFQSEEVKGFSPQLLAAARDVIPLTIMANTGDGGGLHLVFGNPETGDWSLDRIPHLHAIAHHLAAAWRLRTSLNAADTPAAIAAELRVDGTPINLSPDASAPTAREALRRAVIARERARTGRRSAGDHALWPALVAGRWSLLDAFTAAGTRYIVAYENPAGTTELRALPPLERVTLELALAGRSGKWIALELELSEPTVTRTLRAALRRLGVTDIAALAGVPTALFEPLDGVSAGETLAIACLAPAVLALAGLSQAERDIVAGILSGKRLAAIAQDRGTSPRTVAHQTASIYQKLGVASRRELLAQLAWPDST